MTFLGKLHLPSLTARLRISIFHDEHPDVLLSTERDPDYHLEPLRKPRRPSQSCSLLEESIPILNACCI